MKFDTGRRRLEKESLQVHGSYITGEPDIVGVIKGCRLRLSGHILKKIAEKIPLLIYKSLPEGIRPIGDQDQVGKTWSIKKCDNGTGRG